jgi:hypothetical protein
MSSPAEIERRAQIAADKQGAYDRADAAATTASEARAVAFNEWREAREKLDVAVQEFVLSKLSSSGTSK